MKKQVYIFIFFFHFLWFVKPSVAQSFLNLDVAQNFSTFKFSYNPILSDNNVTSPSPDYSQISSTAFGIGYKYLHTTGIFAGGGLDFRKAGASLVYKKTNYLWNLQYFDIKAGIGYQYDKWRIKPYASIMPYYAYLLNAKQSIGTNYFDIKADKALKLYDIGLFLNLGANVTLSQYMAIYAEYSYNLGVKNIETAEEQYLYNRGFAVKVGLSISITNFKKMQDQIAKQQQQELQQQQTIDEGENGGFQPSQFQLAGAKTNTSATNNNSDTNNETAQNTDAQKITSPGTVGWSRNTPTVAPAKTKNIVTEASSSDNQAVKTNTSEAATSSDVENTTGTIKSTGTGAGTAPTSNTSGNNNTTENTNSSGTDNTPGMASTSVPENITKNTTPTSSAPSSSTSPLNANEKTKSEPTDSKSASNPVATYGAVPVTPAKGTNSNEIIPIPASEKNVKKIDSDDKIVFKVQLTAVKNALRSGHPILENIKGDIKVEKGRDGWLRYYLGAYETYEEAYKELKKIKAKGLADGGFIVAFKNGKKITVAEAKELVK